MSETRKPIFCVGIPQLGVFEIDKIYKSIESKIGNEYHVMVYTGNREITFNLFSDKNIQETDLDNLKKLVYENIQSREREMEDR
jgi:hypothetical protein